MAQWTGKVVWITGGGTGLGKYMALRFAELGADIAISGRRADRLEAAAAEIEVHGGQVRAVVCDVTDASSIDEALAEVISAFGKLDVVVANAGMSVAGNFEELTMADWRRQFDVNVCGAAVTVAKAIPHLRKTQGRIALIGSVAAMVHFAKAAPYQASKAAVAALGGSLSVEYASEGITCTTIHPGFVDSDIYKIDNHGHFREERRDRRPKQLIWQTDAAAKVMVQAIYRRKREFVFTGHGRFGWFLGRHFPGFVSQVARRIENNASKK
ncbi:MAG: SDR family NAD(P)-dependent oxidoreductase [Proteobacteria bacterium]|nr:SDR family NAD(P)-dependent oxidoreductase [Pseudomonadota bacterium]